MAPMADGVARRFLEWSAPALPRAAAWLLQRARDEADAGAGDDEADLSGWIVVLPGARAGRVLTGLLVDQAEERGWALTPPLTITPGELPAALLGPPGSPAPALTKRLAWIEALRSLEDEALAALLPRRPAPDDLPAWSRIAQTLERASDDLAGALLRFEDVQRRAGETLPPEEAPRWRALAAAQEAMEGLLRARGVVDEALAMRRVIGGLRPPSATGAAHAHDAGFRRLALVGVPELRPVEREAIALSDLPTDALVFAPASMAAHFDELGCVDAEAWSAAPVELNEDRVRFADDPRDQAERALTTLASWGDPLDVGRVVVGVADPDALPRLRRRAETASGVRLRSATGDPASRTLPGRLLALLGEHLREGSVETLAALSRHPDVEAALLPRSADDEHGAWWLPLLDEIRREHALLDAASPPRGMRPKRLRALRFVEESLRELLGELVESPDALRSPGAWAGAIEQALRAIYAGRALRPDREEDRRLLAGLRAVRRGLDEFVEADRLTQDAQPGASEHASATGAAQAIALLLERLAQESIPEPPRREAIEAIGWLDVAMDPSPRCVVVGMSDARVPGSVTHDALLPGSLRKRLGLATNEARLARDAYLLRMIDASREAVYIATRRGEEGDPQTPSRLLFRAKGETLARRMRRFTQPKHDAPAHARLVSRLRPGDADRFTPAQVVGPGYAPPESMRVTDFGAWMRSPVGWYLERYLGLVDEEAPARDLSPMLFGTLAHAALEAFGRDESARDETDAGVVAAALEGRLDDAAQRLFGANPPMGVRLQCELLRLRLGFFARQQAQRRAEGWRIKFVEWSPREGASIEVDGVAMSLRGKIDRIDIHEDGRWAIIDYKTGSTKVDAAHRKGRGERKEWINLQLPLYRHLVDELRPPREVELGYALLPTKEGDRPWSFADWTPEELLEADEASRSVVRQIRALREGDELPRGDHPPSEGAIGFLTGERFERAGLQPDDDEEVEQ